MLKLIIFDFDGVIISGSNDGYCACYHKALEAVGVTLSPKLERERILAYWGKGHKAQLAYLLKEHPEKLEEANAAYESLYHSPLFHEKIKLVPGADKTIKALAQKYTLAIATGMMRKTLEQYITKFSIPYFSEIMTYEDVANETDRKPSPYMLNEIMKKLHVKPEQAVFVGDAENDVRMAQQADVEPIVVLTGHLTKTEAKKLGVKHILPDVTYLKDFQQQKTQPFS